MTDKAPNNLCAYCGIAVTRKTNKRDHVVPQTFWKLVGLPRGTVTVSACKGCHEHWDKDADYFRDRLISMAKPNSHPAIPGLLNGPVMRNIVRKRKELVELIGTAVQGYRRTESGFLEPAVALRLNVKRFNRTIEKIIRGFFFHLSHYSLPKDYVVKIAPDNSFWGLPDFQVLLSKMRPWEDMGDDIFRMRTQRDSTNENCTAWVLCFFNSIAFYGATLPKSAIKTKSKS